jgi:hypothetical protein
LEQKLLLESEKLTSLINIKSLSYSEADSPQASHMSNSKIKELTLLPLSPASIKIPSEPTKERKASETIRAYI